MSMQTVARSQLSSAEGSAAKILAEIRRVTACNPARRFWFPECIGGDVESVSLELPAASGARSIPAGGWAGMGTTAAKAGGSTGSGFRSFMDDCQAGDVGRGESREPEQRQAPGERNQNDGLAAQTRGPVPPAVTVPLAPAWALTQLGSPDATGLSASEATAAGTQDLSGGSGFPSGSAVLPPWSGTDGPLVGDVALPQDDPALSVNPARGSRSATTTSAAAELAFGLRWLTPEPAASSSGAAALSSAATVPSIAPALPSPAPPRDAGSTTGIAPKGGAPAMEHPPDGRGADVPAAQSDVENAWNMAGPGTADREAQPAAPAQVQSPARPAELELPEPGPQPVSRDVSWHLADGDSSVDIRVAERAGEVSVTVHTPNRDLADSLRADLPDLVGKLRQSGFQAEVWRPAAAQSDAGRRNGSDAAPSQQQSPGDRRNGRQRPPLPQQPKDQTHWAGEWKSSLGPAQESQT